MTGDGNTSTPAEEQFTELLIACDEALAAGIPSEVRKFGRTRAFTGARANDPAR